MGIHALNEQLSEISDSKMLLFQYSNGDVRKVMQNEDIDPRLKSCDPELVAKIELEIVDCGERISFDDIAGLSFAKKCINELVIWPMARPDIFTGLRSLPKGEVNSPNISIYNLFCCLSYQDCFYLDHQVLVKHSLGKQWQINRMLHFSVFLRAL